MNNSTKTIQDPETFTDDVNAMTTVPIASNTDSNDSSYFLAQESLTQGAQRL